jgi:uncharacterized protein (DUF1330 family)
MNKASSHQLQRLALALGATLALGTAVAAPQQRGYLIANFTIHDQDGFRKYREAAGGLAPKYNGKVILYDVQPKALEGQTKSVMVLVEFPSLAEAARFYSSPEYTAAKVLRIAATEGSVVLAEGLPTQP